MKQNVVVISLARVLSITKKLLHIVKNKIRKQSWQLVRKQKSYSKSKKHAQVLLMQKSFQVFLYFYEIVTLKSNFSFLNAKISIITKYKNKKK